MDDLRDWAAVGVIDRPTDSLIKTDVNRINLYVALAVLHRRPRGGMSVTVQWQTFDERYFVRPDKGMPDHDMTYQDGDQILVLVSTVTSTQRGCHNGHARIEAIQTSPGKWCRNAL